MTQIQNRDTAVAPVDRLKNILQAPSVQEQFKNALAENRNLFVASLIDLYASDKNLQQCDPAAIVREALKAAVLQLPIAKSLGFAWIVPYKGVPQFQLGYRGYIQLALRTGVYRYINADAVYEGELRGADKLTGLVDLGGERKSGKVIGYFAYLETVNGFKKAVYWTKEQVTDHAKKFSASFGFKDGAWQMNFDAMAIKTVIRQLISRYGIMSIEMQQALSMDFDNDENELEREVAANANRETIVIDAKPVQERQRRNRQEPAELPAPAVMEPEQAPKQAPTSAPPDPGF